jgi:hypothetical protein
MIFKNICRSWTGEAVRNNYALLRNNRSLCCHLNFAADDDNRFFICMGWHDFGEGHSELVTRPDGTSSFEWVPDKNSERIAWKIALQPHNSVMSCDFDMDFEMPYVTEQMARENPGLFEGDVEDTLEELDVRPRKRGKSHKKFPSPNRYRSWDSLAKHMVKRGIEVFNRWKHEGGSDEVQY